MKSRQHSGTFSVPNSEELSDLLKKTNQRGSRVKHIRHRKEWNAMLKSEQLTKCLHGKWWDPHSLPSPAGFSDCWHPTLGGNTQWYLQTVHQANYWIPNGSTYHVTHPSPVLSLHTGHPFSFLVTVLSREQPARSVWYLRKTSYMGERPESK